MSPASSNLPTNGAMGTRGSPHKQQQWWEIGFYPRRQCYLRSTGVWFHQFCTAVSAIVVPGTRYLVCVLMMLVLNPGSE